MKDALDKVSSAEAVKGAFDAWWDDPDCIGKGVLARRANAYVGFEEGFTQGWLALGKIVTEKLEEEA